MKKLFTLILLYSSIHTTIAQVGIGTASPQAGFHVENGAVVFSAPSDDVSVMGTSSVMGAGRRLVWFPQKSAFLVGRVNSYFWNQAFVGENSFTAGLDAQALAPQSVAMGWAAQANGATSVSLGYRTLTVGAASVAIGDESRSMGDGAVAIGKNLHANSFGETAVGLYNTEGSTVNKSIWHPNDRVFTVGNGLSESSPSNAMVILKTGFVGIGVDSPKYRLEVAGEVKAARVRADNSEFTSVSAENGDVTHIRSQNGEFTSVRAEKGEFNGIKLGPPPYGASTLNYYSEMQIISNLYNGSNVFERQYTVRVVRLGKLVTVTFPRTILNMQVTQHDIVFNGIPGQMRPTNDLVFAVNTQSGGAAKMGVILVKSDGAIFFKPDEKGSAWGGANSGFWATSVSYIVE